MSHIEIIDPGDAGGGGFEPLSPQPRDDRDRIPYDDIPEVRPAMHQRMSSLSIHDNKPNTKVRRDSALGQDGFAYWRLEKEGEDWGSAYRRKLIAPQLEIEKMAKKGKGSVLAETTRMGGLRSQHLTRLVDDLNADERGDERWEPVYIKSSKITRRTGKIECKSMDVIVARRKPSPKPGRKYRSSSGGELVDIITEGKSKGDKKDKKDKDKDKDKKKDKDGEKSSSPKRDSFIDDPFSSQPLFHKTGMPMDDQGILDFRNGGLPAEIPADRPIGYDAREPRDEKKGKSKHGSVKDFDDLGIINVGDFADPSPAVDSLDAILGHETSHEVPHSEPGGRRSRSRRRSKSTRRRSPARPESISFPPDFPRQHGGGYADSSSNSSGQSRYGFDGIDREERSSYTSDTYSGIGRRGSYYDEGRPKVYKEHHRGPSRGGVNYYGDARVYEEPNRSRRRYSRGSFSQAAERIPEARQIAYKDYGGGDLVRRPYDDPDPYYPPQRGRAERPPPVSPILVYPNELPAERYMDERVRDEAVRDDYLSRRERDIRDRELRMDVLEEQREEDLRRAEERLQRDREYEDMRYQEEMDRRHYESRMRAADRRYHDDRYGGGLYGRYE